MSASYDLARIPGRQVDPSSLTHLERDALGHFASAMREADYLARRRSRWNWYAQRYADLTKVLRARVGSDGLIPEGVEDGITIIRCFAYHFQARSDVQDVSARLADWCSRHCRNWSNGWPDQRKMIGTILREVAGRRRDLGARYLARELRVTWAERCRLRLRTIGAFDLTPGEFRERVAERKRAADRTRVTVKRRASGMRTWEERSRLSREQPWTALGISRATYFRRRKAAGTKQQHSETVVSQLGEASNGRDTTVSRQITGEPVQKESTVSVGRDASAGSSSDIAGIAETNSARQEAAASHDALSPFAVAPYQSLRRANNG